jgi:DNA end-binding protein Ku
MDVLKRSLEAEESRATPATPSKAPKAKKSKKAAADQREMLLPISGKSTSKESAKEKKGSGRPAARPRKAG